MKQLDLFVTLWPTFDHFARFSQDLRLKGIRLNSAMMSATEVEKDLQFANPKKSEVPLWFDIKGRQLRVEEVIPNDHYLDLTLNHPIEVPTPTMVLFKAGCDRALLERIEDDGKRLIFRGGPEYSVYPGESLHIRNHDLMVKGPLFTQAELEKIAWVKKYGFEKFFLSYVQSQKDVDIFREIVGKDAEIYLKIEDKKGLAYTANEFKKNGNTKLVAARGDLYVELDRPHEIISALKLIAEKDPEACVGSRILLSVIHEPVPSCADFLEMAWLYDIGYKTMLLCDELCLKENLLATAVNVFESFKDTYVPDLINCTTTPPPVEKTNWWKKFFPN